MTLCYYVTGHGFGHAIRTAQVLKALPAHIPLHLKTTAPERLFREELGARSFTYTPAEYDCGCLQSDSVTTLPRATLDRYAEIAARNRAHLEDEVGWLRANNIACVASDIASFPLMAARAAGIPGVAVANFTWHDIYSDFVQTPADAHLLARMRDEYASATLACVTELSLPTCASVFSRVAHVPIVARRGRSIRAALPHAGRRLALLYLGTWGLDIAWPQLQTLTDWVFLSDAAPPVPVANVIPMNGFAYADVAASVDVVLSKTGYGTVTGCIAANVPLIYLPRHGFAEHAALVEGLARWGGGIALSEADFLAGRWADALDAALAARPDPHAFRTDGASVIAQTLESFL